jgi:hypothetical protein
LSGKERLHKVTETPGKFLFLPRKARPVFALAQKQGDHPAKFGTIGTFYWLKSRKYQL